MTRRRTPKWLTAARLAGAPADFIGRAVPRAGIMTSAALRDALVAGRVAKNGGVVTDQATPLTAGDVIAIDGSRVDLWAPTIVLMFHKRAGLVVSGQDAEGSGTVFDALLQRLPDELRSYDWHAVGRLDRATTGLLLFTNDERVVEHVTSPATKLSKRYVVTTDSRIRADEIATLVQGVMIEDGLAVALSARVKAPGQLEIVIAEGRHHQVRRMMNAAHLVVIALHREAIGEVVLDVPLGNVRPLSDDEVTKGLGFTASRGSPSSSRRTPPE